ncbi:CopG family transcriptional regulator [Thermococcus sp.]|uniref:CopG family transcriptional regulator n=1 Tax=Thermococcus sp. TaxID=35749 RepID=UPI00260F7426|nr:CopG family transcriptional regulator [Thermococcus sp.]
MHFEPEVVKVEELVAIKIPKSLHERIKERIEGTGFESVDEYVTYVLREVLANLEEEEEEVFSEEEEEKVKERLRALGYLD